jgi:mRNA interferase RelE/StbE
VTFQIEIKPAAQRQIKKLPPSIQEKIFQALEELKFEPRPSNAKKMVGEENAYRVRVGKYRIVYEIYERVLLVVVVQVGHRREIYRKL